MEKILRFFLNCCCPLLLQWQCVPEEAIELTYFYPVIDFYLVPLFFLSLNNLDSLAALVCASQSNLKKHILLFCLVNTFIAISCNTVYCSSEEFTWIFRFFLPMHALPMTPCTFSQAGTCLAACCLCQSNHPCKITFGWGGVFYFTTIYNCLPNQMNSCTVTLRFLFQFIIPKSYHGQMAL